jgi:hypothetical protein
MLLASGCGSSGSGNTGGAGAGTGGASAGAANGGSSGRGGSASAQAGSGGQISAGAVGGASTQAGAAGESDQGGAAGDASGGTSGVGGSSGGASGGSGGSGGAASCSPSCAGVCSHAHCVVGTATGMVPATGLAVDETYIYFGTNQNPNIYRMPIAGGAPTLLVTKGGVQETEDIVLVGSTLYWTTNSGQNVLMAPKTGDTATVVSKTEQIPYGIASNGTDVFWANHYQAANSIGHALVAGGGKNPIISGSPQVVYPTYVAADATYVYWGNAGQSGTDGSVYRAKLDGTSPVAIAHGQGPVYGIAIDATTVYFTTTSGTVASVPKTSDGSVTPTQLGQGEGYVLGIAVDATDIYWVDEGNARIRHRAKTANAPDTFADLKLTTVDPYLGSVTYITLDSSHVYWSDLGTQFGHSAVMVAER